MLLLNFTVFSMIIPCKTQLAHAYKIELNQRELQLVRYESSPILALGLRSTYLDKLFEAVSKVTFNYFCVPCAGHMDLLTFKLQTKTASRPILRAGFWQSPMDTCKTSPWLKLFAKPKLSCATTVFCAKRTLRSVLP